ncbi:MAG: hypothetical protein Q9182_002258 [Xanthomendoza sp. 2 TL-2023]
MKTFRSFYSGRILLEQKETTGNEEHASSRWRSKDLDPVSQPDKKWEWYHVGGFWIAEGFSAAQIQTSSAAIAIGLNPGLALAAYLVGNLIIAVACCGSGYIGSKYSINFPVIARAYVNHITSAERSGSTGRQHAGSHAIRTQSSVIYDCTGDWTAGGIDAE